MRRKGRNFISTTSAPTQALRFQYTREKWLRKWTGEAECCVHFCLPTRDMSLLSPYAVVQVFMFAVGCSWSWVTWNSKSVGKQPLWSALENLFNVISRGALIIEMFYSLSFKRFSLKTRWKAQVTVSSRIIANSNTAQTSPALSCEVFNATLKTKRTNFRLTFIVRLECRSFTVKPHLNEHQPQIFLKGSFELASFSSPLWLETIHLEVLPRQCIGIVGMRHEGDDAKERSLSRH